MPNIESSVQNILNEIGVPTHVPGGPYLREAICIAVDNPGVMDAIDEVLYPQIAKVFYTKPDRVDRQIRYAIEIACDRGDLETLQKFFGPTVTGSKSKPSNSKFVTRIAEHVKNQQDNTCQQPAPVRELNSANHNKEERNIL